jgi:hypothetical protein
MSFATDMRVLLSLMRGLPRRGSHAERLQDFYGPQAARYDDRDDEDIACEMWARRLASRDLAMAQPFKNFPMADEMAAEREKPQSPAERDKPQVPAGLSHPR